MGDEGKRIKELRLKRGMTLEQLGEKVGVGKSTVLRWETGSVPSIKGDKVDKIAAALGVDPSYIMGWDSKKVNVLPIDKNREALLEAIKDFDDVQIARLTAYADFIRGLD